MKISQAADELWRKFNARLTLATPLGIGKPNALLNLLYQKAKADPNSRLIIYTGLSLVPPHPQSSLEKRFLDSFRERHWGKDYPELDYLNDGVSGGLPTNIEVHEFYFQAGVMLHSPKLQQQYQSLNYTHVAAQLLRSEVQIIVQLIARDDRNGPPRYSLASNPDVSVDLVDLYRQNKKEIFVVGVIHPDLPFVSGEAEVAADFFDWIVDDASVNHTLFALPKLPIDSVDHAIGFHASQLIVDDGTLQIGIGSLSEAIVASLILRQKKNSDFRSLCVQAQKTFAYGSLELADGPFIHGLYGLSELVTDGFMHLRRAEILKREVIDEKSGTRTYLHGAFFLGSKELYRWLREINGEDYAGLRMGRVSKVNDLYDPHEVLLRRQRKNPRFLNTCMQVTLLGGAASDTLADGRVVSGVGGQYNFVAMAHELQNSRSILLLRSTRNEKGKRVSNIVASHGHLTIPRHLRDIVITEYGIADLRGKTDAETVAALLAITDSEFQAPLLASAKRNGKISSTYQIPLPQQNNTPEKIRSFGRAARGIARDAFSPYPFGSDFTAVEQRLAKALAGLQRAVSQSLFSVAKIFCASFRATADDFLPELQRMGFADLRSWKAALEKRLVLGALALSRKESDSEIF